MKYVLELPGRPPTANKARNSHAHWAQSAKVTQQWRFTAAMMWRSGVQRGIYPRQIDAVGVSARQLSKDRRWLQDLGACMPAAKAAIDGLVDAELIADDTPRYVRTLAFLPPLIVGRDALEIVVYTFDVALTIAGNIFIESDAS